MSFKFGALRVILWKVKINSVGSEGFTLREIKMTQSGTLYVIKSNSGIVFVVYKINNELVV